MQIYKATNTLDLYLPQLDYVKEKSKAQLLIVGGKQINLSEYPMLKGIFKTGVGTDNLPFEAASARNIEIVLPSSETCDVVYEETACFTCHLILAGIYLDSGDWHTWIKRDRLQLSGRKLLVIGAGRIGRRVIDKMSSFMDVDSYDSLTDSSEMLEPKIRSADCISLHVPLTSETHHMIDKEKLEWMRDETLIVNTARAPVIDEDALINELQKGRLRAAIDVFWQEPYCGKLTAIGADRFIRTPHIASTCKEFLMGTANDFLNFKSRMESQR